MSNKQIGLFALTALVLSSMIGSGIFSLPQNMAEVAGAKALLIGWSITGVGIIFLGLSFFFLSRLRPDLNGGVYTYAKEGFGGLVGFFSAWGYWLCSGIGSVSYLVVAFEGIGTFVDTQEQIIFGTGSTLYSILGASLVVWLVHWLIARGVREAAFVNMLATVVKVFPLILFIILAALYFSPTQFFTDFNGESVMNQNQSVDLITQVKNTMLITLWVFVGVEGASILSGHARRQRDIGTATVLGICITLVLYVAITVLALGVLPRETISTMSNPSMAPILESMIGKTGKIIITLCLIVSVLGSYISWTMYCTEVPYRGVESGAFPRMLSKLNKNNTPINSLWFTNIVIQLCLILVLFTSQSYTKLISLATSMILVPYILIGAYLFKLALQNKAKWYIQLTGLMATLYGLWIVYAAGMDYLFLSVVLYVPGVTVYLYSQYQQKGKFDLSKKEWALLIILIGVFLIACWELSQGLLSI
ncbi:basic amino acid/polyamine antiporter [Rodentibacter pneumotropicus]|uniref:Amino acid permease n=1 Tax=Rodentibacter pneumotropicus TaxID=758 RepID=A0A4S2PX72_9PAST|nr:basic amino acid/polyamine antiporter [Rodentibacter pneumotropicus]THA08499.1 amino acid permease [Rodentibacter pneumotropicus]